MPIYRKKPVEIEAMQFTDESKDRVLSWASQIQANIFHDFDSENKPIIIIPTLQGKMICRIGDYLIKEPFPINGKKLYPCEPTIFEQTYDKIE